MKRFGFLIAMTIFVAACGNATAIETSSALTDESSGAPAEESVVATTTTVEPTRDEPVPQESTTVPPNEPPAGMIYVGAQVVPEVLEDFEFIQASLDDEELFVAVAATGAHRQQGLMHITDLGTLSGMVFIFENDSSGAFWMKNTLIPLDIAFFDADGRFVDGFVMEPCTTENCPTYRPSGSYRYALEMMAGEMHPDPQVLVLGDRL
jgi:uncharacterized membrane protein (UPF0127 family)